MKPEAILVGVVGDSAAGKTTLSRGLQQILGEDQVTVICSDDYHRYNRKQRKEMGISALDPDCNYVDIIEQHFQLLRGGQPILKPIYNHSTGDFDPPEYIKPGKFVVIEGLLGFHSRVMRRCFDVKVYLDPLDELRREWKIKRDTTRRGYTREQVLVSLRKRTGDTARYIRSQRVRADIVVRFYPPENQVSETGSRLNARIVLRPTIPHPDLSTFLRPRGTGHPALHLELGRDEGKPVDFLDIDGHVSDEEARALEDLIWGSIPDASHLRPGKLGLYQDGLEEFQSHPLALAQLLIAYHMIKAKNEVQD